MGLQDILEWKYLPYAVAGLTVVATVPCVIRAKNNWDRKKLRATYPKDTVVVHQIGRGPWAPSMSPFPLKLETYLRMADIPNQSVHGMELSTKDKTPFMVYNGEEIADSQFCLEYLNDKLGIDLSAHLSDKERGIARAFQKMAEEDMFWGMILWRYAYDPDVFVERPGTFATGCVPMWVVARDFRRRLVRMPNGAWGHGIGRHSQQQVMGNVFRKDLQALSAFLGDKPYLMGDKPCEEDCAIFGQLAQVLWHMPGSGADQWLKDGEFSNLGRYCERMKERFWPDWEECITHGCTTKTSK